MVKQVIEKPGSKYEMVKAALKANPTFSADEIRDWVKEHFDETIASNTVSSYKSQISREGLQATTDGNNASGNRVGRPAGSTNRKKQLGAEELGKLKDLVEEKGGFETVNESFELTKYLIEQMGSLEAVDQGLDFLSKFLPPSTGSKKK